MSPSECPSHEELAAFIDDGLTLLEWSDVIFHLTICERCFSLYIETMHLLLESDTEGVPQEGADA
jgi:hypothetical protein